MVSKKEDAVHTDVLAADEYKSALRDILFQANNIETAGNAKRSLEIIRSICHSVGIE